MKPLPSSMTSLFPYNILNTLFHVFSDTQLMPDITHNIAVILIKKYFRTKFTFHCLGMYQQPTKFSQRGLGQENHLMWIPRCSITRVDCWTSVIGRGLLHSTQWVWSTNETFHEKKFIMSKLHASTIKNHLANSKDLICICWEPL